MYEATRSERNQAVIIGVRLKELAQSGCKLSIPWHDPFVPTHPIDDHQDFTSRQEIRPNTVVARRKMTIGCQPSSRTQRMKMALSNPIVLQHIYCSENNRLHGTIKHIHSSHLPFCSRLAICDHSRKLRPQSQLCDYCDRMMQSQLATLVASRPSQINIYIYQTILV